MSHLTAADIVHDEYLKTSEGRATLKQMIEEAEKEELLTLDGAISAYARAIRADASSCRSPEVSRAISVTREAIKATAQREYGKVGVEDSNVKLTARDDYVVIHVGLSNWLIDRSTVPGILYALSTLEEKE